MKEQALKKIEAAIELRSGVDNLPCLLAIANSADPYPSLAANALRVDAHAISLTLSEEELAAVNDDEGRRFIRACAAEKYYRHFIFSAEDPARKAALKAIADKPAADTEADIRGRLDAERAHLGFPEPNLNAGIGMINMERASSLRKAAAMRLLRLKIGEINDLSLLVKLREVQSFADFRRTFQDHPDNDQEALKVLKFGDDLTDQTVVDDEQLRELKKIAVKKYEQLYLRQRIATWSTGEDNIKLNGPANPEQDEAFAKNGYLKESEFYTMVTELVGAISTRRGEDPAAAAGAIEEAKKSIEHSRDKRNKYSVKLPGDMKLTEEVLDQNKVNTSVTTSSDAVTPEDMFFAMARTLYLRFKQVKGIDPANQELRINDLPTFIDKRGVVHRIGDEPPLKLAFDRALQAAGFRKVIFASELAVRAELIPSNELMPGGVAPAV